MNLTGIGSMFSQLWKWRSSSTKVTEKEGKPTLPMASSSSSPPPPPPPLLSLPNELILEISTYLTTPQDLLSLILTTRQFSPLLKPILTTHALSSPTYPGALQTAARASNLPLVCTLLRTIPVDDGLTRRLETPLHYALKAPTHRRTPQTTTIVALLIFHGADISARGVCGITPLHYAAFYNLPECAKLLLAAGASPNAADNFGRTPLHCAAASGATPVVRLLLENGADARVRDRYYRQAVSYGNAYYRLGCTTLLYAAMGEKWEYPPRVQMRCLVLDALLGLVFKCRGRIGFLAVLALALVWVVPAVVLVAVGRVLRLDRVWMLARWALGLVKGPEWEEYGVGRDDVDEDLE